MAVRTYCEKCGSLCNQWPVATGSFDKEGGYPTYRIKIKCPNRRFIFDRHTDTYVGGYENRFFGPTFEPSELTPIAAAHYLGVSEKELLAGGVMVTGTE
jgi:hypothetical protein